MVADGPASARRGGFRWLSVIVWVMLGLAVAFSGCVAESGHEFAYQATCGPNPPTQWRLECTYIGLGASTSCLIVALVLLIRGHRIGTVVALLFVCGAALASVIAWLLPVFASALC